MKGHRAWVLIALSACLPPASTAPSGLRVAPAVGVPAPAASAEDGVPLASAPAVRVRLRAPARVPYVFEALAPAALAVSVTLTNTGPAAVPLGALHLAFRATRDGVTYPCGEHPEHATPDRAPASLAPGRALTFDADVDCSMPLPGTYEVVTYLETGTSQRLGAFVVDVVPGARAPAPYAGVPGLFVAMTGPAATRPLPPDAWARGDYRVVIALVNGSSHVVELGRAHAAFLTYKSGAPLPCSGDEAKLDLPSTLWPGSVVTVRVPVACAPADEGRYEIVGRFGMTTDRAHDDVEMGRVRLRVTTDPLLYNPDPWPSRARGAPSP